MIDVLTEEPLGTISPLIHSYFTEELGAVIYDGVWVGENSKIANTGGKSISFTFPPSSVTRLTISLTCDSASS